MNLMHLTNNITDIMNAVLEILPKFVMSTDRFFRSLQSILNTPSCS